VKPVRRATSRNLCKRIQFHDFVDSMANPEKEFNDEFSLAK